MSNRKTASVCPYIDCYVATLGLRQMGHGMDYSKGRSSISGYGIGSCLAKLFCSGLALAK